MIIEGDIIVPIDFYETVGLKATWDTNLWPNGIVPYEFDTNVTATNQTAMISATLEWENVANVDFRPRNGEPDYIHIQNANENSSFIGRLGGMQVVNIFNWNWRFIMAHELGHALGFWHEQSRPNRDTFVQINDGTNGTVNCILPGSADNFQIHNNAGQYPPNGYDFDSVMHYGDTAFLAASPVCTRTITVLPPNQAWQNLIGQRTHLSDLDELTMSFLYPEDNWRFVDRSYTGGTENGTFLEPYKQFTAGANGVPSGGTLWIQPGTYSAVGVYNKSMTLKAPLGGVTLGP